MTIVRIVRRNALDIVSDIGVIAFDLQRHTTEEIKDAVALLRTANPQLFDWLIVALGGTDMEAVKLAVQAKIRAEAECGALQATLATVRALCENAGWIPTQHGGGTPVSQAPAERWVKAKELLALLDGPEGGQDT